MIKQLKNLGYTSKISSFVFLGHNRYNKSKWQINYKNGSTHIKWDIAKYGGVL